MAVPYRRGTSWIGISPDPRQGPESTFPGKEGFGVLKHPFPVALTKGGKGSLRSKKSPFSMPLENERGFFDRNQNYEGKWGFLDPETLFSRKWGFGPLSGVGGIPTLGSTMLVKLLPRKIKSSSTSDFGGLPQSNLTSNPKSDFFDLSFMHHHRWRTKSPRTL